MTKSTSTSIAGGRSLHLSLLLVLSLGTITTTWGFTTSSLPKIYQQRMTTTVVVRNSAVDTTEEQVETLTVAPIKSLDGVVTLPGSKSLSNRCLLLAALSKGTTRVENLLESDDIRYMLEALETLGVPVETVNEDTVVVTGQDGPLPNCDGKPTELFLGNAGTAMRPLAAALSLTPNANFVLDGVPRMRERPIADLVDGLQQLGASVECVKETGCPPVTITPSAGFSTSDDDDETKQKTALISGKMSSQFLSSLLMAAPLLDRDVVLTIKDELISAPYVALTIGLMQQFGVTVEIQDADDDSGKDRPLSELDTIARPQFTIRADASYVSPETILVEGDASSASYFLAGAAITGGTVTVRGCGSKSVQGDVAFANVLEQMGATVTWDDASITVTRNGPLKGVDVDCGKIPDAAMTLAVVALFAEGPTTIRNVYSWRLKETERMKAIVAECTKLGATVEEFRDYCVITPPKDGAKGVPPDVEIETYDDHRMAMTFSLAACAGVNVIIRDPKCTAKTFPTYFDTLDSIKQ
mmetsp:Transcript_28616/g.42306  ORF Transcript_28616/g.42306 Transcript_28616/m.42306 type:complete len:527 (+) Transcript_28616:178-1758(+)|eukprot:CAMPEP_0194235496 /NCGR_PEP_ID=MMETSP0158-20130606/2968_1 /TAXON_ID=33649 /ORGANISM="Thalassionema nitzschioides, Strain L26-B" /LENGTH=526 /DNA_ID=CAMNT_0038968979 /DNA_START=173 /DNA_END=1753 /DNA_ORIENTATION=+